MSNMFIAFVHKSFGPVNIQIIDLKMHAKTTLCLKVTYSPFPSDFNENSNVNTHFSRTTHYRIL